MVENILNQISRELEGIPGIIGIVLGGSRARGTHHEKSDIDIGIYYDETEGFDIRELGKVAAKLDDEHRENLITQIGGWGPWVNAGGWLVIQEYHVDFILRDIKRVSQVIDDCLAGKVSAHYQTGSSPCIFKCNVYGRNFRLQNTC
jgi:predicted nucleotidyltransferase